MNAIPVLRTHDLSLSYGRLRAVDRLSISVDQGEIYGFLGRNGAGKTSTIRMLMGIVRPDAGRIEMLDYQGKRIGVQQKRRVGYVSQEQHFYPWMTARVLGKFVAGFYPAWDHAEFGRLLSVLDVPPDRRVSHLSGGMRVKLGLALALAHHPALLILDEPTSGLDPVGRREFLEIVQRQARRHQRTTFFSSHLVDEVERVADRVGILHRGQLRYEGSVEAIQESVRKVVYDDESAEVMEAIVVTESGAPVDDFRPPSPSAETSGFSRRRVLELAATHGFEYLRDGFGEERAVILRAAASQWQAAPFPRAMVQRLSLEDIFIALASEVSDDL